MKIKTSYLPMFLQIVLIGGIRISCCITILFSSATIYASTDSAMVLNILSGKAQYCSEERKGEIVQILDFLAKGEQLNLEGDARICLNYFESGIREEIRGNGRIEIGTEQSEPFGNLQISNSKAFEMPGKAIMEIRDLQHVGTTVLRSAVRNIPMKNEILDIQPLTLTDTNIKNPHPIFSWNTVTGADHYRIRLTDTSDDLQWEIDTKDPFKKYAGHLKNGELYWWTVLAFANNRIIAKGDGQFSLLSRAEIEKIEAAEQTIVRNFPYSETERLLYHAMLYRQYELFDDLTLIVRSIYKKQPKNPTIRQWLKSLDETP